MPVYNAGKFLVPAIESIINQTYKNIEFVIVDDGSTDGSWQKIQMYEKQYPNLIHAYRTETKTNAAGNGATNYGMQFAHGEFIARMDADDISYPTRIKKQVAYLMQHPNVILCGTQARIINKQGKIAGNKTMPTDNANIYRMYGVIHPIIHPTVMIRRSMLPFPTKIYAMKWDVNDDYYTFFSLLPRGFFANLPDYLLQYRIHGSNLSLQHPKEKFLNSVKIRFDAIIHLGYKISITSLLLMLIQTAVVFVIPESLVVPLYMIYRGMQSPRTTYRAVKKTLSKMIPKTSDLFHVPSNILRFMGYTK